MPTTHPQPELDPRFSSPNARPASWSDASKVLENAGVYWLATVREDGQPHVTPVAGLWYADQFVFSTGPGEQKALNLARNPRCTVTVGQPDFWDGLDVIVEGEVELISDPDRIESLVREFERKYQGFFGFVPADGAFANRAGGVALVYQVNARKVFGFTRGQVFSQTRWTQGERG